MEDNLARKELVVCLCCLDGYAPSFGLCSVTEQTARSPAVGASAADLLNLANQKRRSRSFPLQAGRALRAIAKFVLARQGSLLSCRNFSGSSCKSVAF